eukprot:CAMPEP_0206503838 /NCGR_PEP_ID=MMETSP0324_2-20121206/55033_1 /ASSEMBLY_ACC=CAM_ASM_000836 /TAXON_ID=2866 /ORGANISM="Crypthecodinium cohnii, Strain Seligo" /LENGTH=109 /DNA_ID=CAMNT_0053992703 /DNA_START=135 /DNA_END=464 /DNA_ORIENTATION=+
MSKHPSNPARCGRPDNNHHHNCHLETATEGGIGAGLGGRFRKCLLRVVFATRSVRGGIAAVASGSVAAVAVVAGIVVAAISVGAVGVPGWMMPMVGVGVGAPGWPTWPA